MARGTVAVGVLMAAFLVYLWRYSPETEDEVLAWLQAKDLADLRHLPNFGEIHSIKNLPGVDLTGLKDALPPPILTSLHAALGELQLQLWLEEVGLSHLLPLLLREGVSSQEKLLELDSASAIKMTYLMPSSATGQKFLKLLSDLKRADDESSMLKRTGSGRSVKGSPGFDGSGKMTGTQEREGERGNDEVTERIKAQLGKEALSSGLSIGGVLRYLVFLVVVFLIITIVLAVVYVVGVTMANVVLTVFATIAVSIVSAILSAIFRGRRGPPAPNPTMSPPIIRSRPSVAGFIAFLFAIATTLFQRVRERLQLTFPRQQTRWARMSSSNETPEFRLGLVERISGQYLDTDRCTAVWNHDDGAEVGGASVVTVHLFCRNSTPYKLQTSDTLKVSISHRPSSATVSHVIEPTPPTGHSILRLSFTTRLTGKYTVDVRINGRKIAGFPIVREYQPGPVDPAKTTFIDQTQWLVLTAGVYYSILVSPRDTFGNPANIIQEHLTLRIRKNGPEGLVVNPECVVERLSSSRFELLLKVEAPGHYVGCILYKEEVIGPSSFTIISLSRREEGEVEKYVSKKNVNSYYEAAMTGEKGKQKRVYCYLYSKQVQVKEFYLKIIPYRLYTCKVCPSTSIKFHPLPGQFTLDDGYQESITLHSPHREVIAAIFYKFVLRNIGGSEQFKDKEQFFFTELQKHHSKSNRSDLKLVVNRFNLLESAMQTTKPFNSSEWCRSFVIKFREEEALDWGGVSRELFQLLCVRCFDCSNGMFKRFKDDTQALVHPNHKHPPNITLKHYEFAGRVVGKCLYESAMGNRLLVTARFTRSFLAQIIGLRINHRYFGSDDPDLYTTKIHYIRQNDVTDLGLVFAEEEFSEGEPPKVVPLVDHGEEIEVTEENKVQYLNLLAQHRLAKQTKQEVEHFLKGLNELVPDHLLSIFDENELELLICGTETVSYDDLKKHAVVSPSANPAFQTLISWFWIAISNFTQEEMARLLQFVTGCSQLPPGGFKELRPKFQITSAPTHGRLPTAHTCFNQLCLPEYDSCEQFQSALMMAINEGAEGFGFL